jgi:nucleoside-diphosphate-sugar epimerase
MLRTVAITGVSGFIGGAVARQLVAARWRVRALIRPGTAARRIPAEVIPVQGRLEDLPSLQALVSDADAVVHCAGAIRGSTESHFHGVNVDGVARLASAAAQRVSAPRFVLVSSLAARQPELSPYAASKRAGEAALAKAAMGMPWTVLRPPAVYGPGDRALLPVLRWMARGLAPQWGADDDRFSLLHVDDLGRAVMTCLEARHPSGSTFELHDGQPQGYDWAEVIDIVGQVCGRRVRRIRVPGLLLDVLATLNLQAGQAVGYAAMLTPWKLRELRYPDWTCENGAFTDATGWTPQTGLAVGIRRTLELDAPTIPELHP